MPLIILPSEKAGRGRGPGTGEGGFLPRSLASPSPENAFTNFSLTSLANTVEGNKKQASQGRSRFLVLGLPVDGNYQSV